MTECRDEGCWFNPQTGILYCGANKGTRCFSWQTPDGSFCEVSDCIID
jgi:hypothetical protein